MLDTHLLNISEVLSERNQEPTATRYNGTVLKYLGQLTKYETKYNVQPFPSAYFIHISIHQKGGASITLCIRLYTAEN